MVTGQNLPVVKETYKKVQWSVHKLCLHSVLPKCTVRSDKRPLTLSYDYPEPLKQGTKPSDFQQPLRDRRGQNVKREEVVWSLFKGPV